MNELKKNELTLFGIIKTNSKNNVCTLTNKEFENFNFSKKKVNRYLTKFTELKLIKLEYDSYHNRTIFIINNMKEKTNNGIWLEAEIAGIENLDIPNVVLLQEIILLSKEKNCCFASNEHFAALLKINKSSASKRISQLVKLEYITTKNIFNKKNCLGRMITPNFEKIKSVKKIELPEVCEENNNPTAAAVKKIEDTIESTNTSEGILIQEEILVNKNLDWNNKPLLQEIINLSKEKNYCSESDVYFSKLLHITRQAASKRINQLAELGYILVKKKIKQKYCVERIIKPNLDKIVEEYNVFDKNNIQADDVFSNNSDSIKNNLNKISTEINEINKRREFLEKQYYYLSSLKS
jgi:Mn-dependent DtxR family transcriptional regulator